MRNLAQYVTAKLFNKDPRGVTAIEYGLLAALIAVVIVGAVTLVGEKLVNTFNAIANSLP